MPTASGQRGACPKFHPVVGCLSPPRWASVYLRSPIPSVRPTPTVPRCRGGKVFWLCRRSPPPHPPHPEPNKQESGRVPPGGQGCLMKSVSLVRAFPACSTPVWQGCRPSVPGALAFPASLARSVPGFRSVGWAGWLGSLCLRLLCGSPAGGCLVFASAFSRRLVALVGLRWCPLVPFASDGSGFPPCSL